MTGCVTSSEGAVRHGKDAALSSICLFVPIGPQEASDWLTDPAALGTTPAITRPCLDPAGHSGMRKDILGVLCVKPGPTLPPSCLLLWSHHWNALGPISPWNAGPSPNSSSMLLRQTELLLELLGGPGPCCHLCILSSYNSNWQLICLSNLINKDNSNWHVRCLMHPSKMHMRVHGSKRTCHATGLME